MFGNQSKQVVKVKLLYYGINKCVHRTIPNNKPDVINRDNEKKGTCILLQFMETEM